MDEIGPEHIEAFDSYRIAHYNIRCTICAKMFKFTTRIKTPSEAFVCLRCTGEIEGIEKIMEDTNEQSENLCR